MSLEVEQRDGVFTASGVDLTGVGVAELLVTEALPLSVIFNVGYSIIDYDGVPAGAADMAADIGIRAAALKMADGQEMLAIASTDLRAFFVGWKQFGGYNVDVLAWGLPPGPEDIERISAAVERSREGGEEATEKTPRPAAPASSLIVARGTDDLLPRRGRLLLHARKPHKSIAKLGSSPMTGDRGKQRLEEAAPRHT